MSARNSSVGVVALLAVLCCVFASSVAASTRIYPLSVTLTAVTPNHGNTGDAVTISGSHLESTKSVEFGSVAADNFTVDPGGNWVKATIPAGLSNGALQITLSVLGIDQSIGPFYIGEAPAAPAPGAKGQATTPAAKGATVVAPRITRFSPAVGKVGTKVTINGVNLRGATWLKIGGVNAKFTVTSANFIVAIVPSHVHSGKITVHTKAGTAVSSASFRKS